MLSLVVSGLLHLEIRPRYRCDTLAVRSEQKDISQVSDWTAILEQIIENRKNGKLGGEVLILTLQNGGLKIQYDSGYSLPAGVRAAAEKAIEGIRNGSIKVQP